MSVTTLRTVQRLARSGDTERAWQLFETSGLAHDTGSADALSLKGRLVKDRALKTAGEERSALLDAAHGAYLAAAALRPATYPLINAATIALLAGNRTEARRTAERILAMLDSRAHEPETDYWLKATRAEAYLLLDRHGEAQAALAEAMRAAPAAWEDHASTLRHFRLIHDEIGAPATWLNSYRPPASLHFSGIIHLDPHAAEAQAAIEAAIDECDPGFAFGALAAGADIVAAEILVRRGAELHVVLPASIAAFRRDSVAPFGADWCARFDRLIGEAAMVETIGELDRVSDAGIAMADQMAMGLTIRQARILESRAQALRIGQSQAGRAAARRRDEAWKLHGLPLRMVDVARSDGDGAKLPALARQAMLAMPAHGPVEACVAEGGTAQEPRGGCAMIGFDEPVAAARAALAVAGRHAVPVGLDYVAFDPDEGGSDRFDLACVITRAAAPGQIFVSRPMALALTLLAPAYGCENFGEIATAHGDVSLAILKPR